MKAIAYIRVSGKGQVDGDGPDRQRESILRFCVEHGLDYGAECFETGVSGTVEGLDRPEFTMAVQLAISCQAAIVVERMDRLARDLMVQELLLRECRTCGIKVFSADQGLMDMAGDGGDPSRVLIRQIMGAIAQWEKSVIVLKLRKARDKKRAATGRCEGPRPYGSLPGEPQVICLAETMMREGRATDEIVGALDDLGFKRRSGKPWTNSSVFRLLQQIGKKKGRNQ